ncbi:ABC transporter substrate-binding protein [Actinomycetes bacterium KLBMP 9797]
MIRRSRALAATVLATALLVAAGCSDDSASGSDSDSGSSGTPDKITYVTAFGAVGRDAFAWVAKEKGYFKEANLEVDIQLGKATGENIKTLNAGKADFVNLDMIGGVITEGKAETPPNMKAVLAVHQSTLVSIISLEGYNVTSPKDLEGKKIAAATGSVNQLLFPAYARLAGIDEKKITWQNAQTTQLTGLLTAHRVDALSTFLIGKTGIENAAKPKKAVVLPYSNYLTDLYGNGIFTSNDTAKNKPELVKRFRDAMLKALQYTVDNPEEAAKILNAAQPDSKVPAAVGEITSMAPYTKPTSGAPLGTIDPQRMAKAIALLESLGLIRAGLKPEDVVATDLTVKA